MKNKCAYRRHVARPSGLVLIWDWRPNPGSSDLAALRKGYPEAAALAANLGLSSFAQSDVSAMLARVLKLTAPALHSAARAMFGLKELPMAKTGSPFIDPYHAAGPGRRTACSQEVQTIHRSAPGVFVCEFHPAPANELPAPMKADVLSGRPVVLGGLEFRAIDGDGALLIDSDSQRWLGRLGSKERNQRAILHLITFPLAQ